MRYTSIRKVIPFIVELIRFDRKYYTASARNTLRYDKFRDVSDHLLIQDGHLSLTHGEQKWINTHPIDTHALNFVE